MNFSEATRQAERALLVTGHRMNTELIVPCQPDETSMLFKHGSELDDYVEWAQEVGFEHFNSVRDGMKLTGLAPEWQASVVRTTGFNVRFEFLRIPGAPWRIEAMCVEDGWAPLHEAHIDKHGTCSVIHVSYKPDNYDKELETLGDVLDFNAEYRNTYGTFSYWSFGSWYVKPRMAFRDHVPTEVLEHVTG